MPRLDCPSVRTETLHPHLRLDDKDITAEDLEERTEAVALFLNPG